MCVEAGEQPAGVVGAQVGIDTGHAVPLFVHRNPSASDPVLMLLLTSARIEREHGSFDPLPEHRDRHVARRGIDAALERGDRRIIELAGGLDHHRGVRERQRALGEQIHRVRQPID